uniref:(northern house mosquito) hypothetical protein n=1 Tax=Culex pipiens TaxID=7175 RepID=A0A8D8FAG3_CULPI
MQTCNCINIHHLYLQQSNAFRAVNKFSLPRFLLFFPTPRRQSRTSGGPSRAVRAVPAGNSRQHLHQRPADGHLRWHSVLFRARLLRQQIAAHLSAEQWRH